MNKFPFSLSQCSGGKQVWQPYNKYLSNGGIAMCNAKVQILNKNENSFDKLVYNLFLHYFLLHFWMSTY